MQSESTKKSLTIVIPVYNEAENLPTFAPTTIEFCKVRGWDVIFVNDGSKDRTKDILAGFASLDHVHILHHKVNRGYGGALKTGIRHVRSPYLITMDGDGQHRLEDIEQIFRVAIEEDADMIVGKREGAKVSTPYRALGKFIIRSFVKMLMPLQITDINSGFKLYRTELAQRYISVCPDSMAFSDVITLTFINERNSGVTSRRLTRPPMVFVATRA